MECYSIIIIIIIIIHASQNHVKIILHGVN
jgi:hypothetical protein